MKAYLCETKLLVKLNRISINEIVHQNNLKSKGEENMTGNMSSPGILSLTYVIHKIPCLCVRFALIN